MPKNERKFKIGDRVSFDLPGSHAFGKVVDSYRNCGDPHGLPAYLIKLERNGSVLELCESVLNLEDNV